MVLTDESVPVTQPVVVPPGGSPDPLPVVLAPRTPIHVQVATLSDSGIAASAVLRDGQGRPLGPFGPVVREEEATTFPVVDGRLVLSVLPPGEWTIELSGEDGRVWTETVTTQPGQPAKLVLE